MARKTESGGKGGTKAKKDTAAVVDKSGETARKDRLKATPISSRLPGARRAPVAADWAINGELILNCSCEVFCPCVVSLGQHPPTYGFCHAWVAVRIDEGHMGDTRLDGLNAAMLLDIPGKMGDGNWSVGLYIDERADDDQFAAIEQALSGQAGGTTGLFRLLVGNYLGAKRVPVSYSTDGDVRTFQAGKAIMGSIRPIEGTEPGQPVTIENSRYWMAPRVIIARAQNSRLRDFGRVWNFDDKSADITNIRWSGP